MEEIQKIKQPEMNLKTYKEYVMHLKEKYNRLDNKNNDLLLEYYLLSKKYNILSKVK